MSRQRWLHPFQSVVLAKTDVKVWTSGDAIPGALKGRAVGLP